jgi:hypothetical protein
MRDAKSAGGLRIAQLVFFVLILGVSIALMILMPGIQSIVNLIAVPFPPTLLKKF